MGDELLAGDDELSEWVRELNEEFFIPVNMHATWVLEKVAIWVTNQNYTTAAVSTFLKAADYYLIAQAVAGNYTVVTHEVAAPSIKKIKIPH